MRAIRILCFFLLLPVLALAQPSLDDIVPRIRRNTVTIRSPERPLRQGQIFDPYSYFFQTVIPPGKGSYPLGTAFILPDGIHCVTSYRQLEGSSRFQVVSDQGKVYEAQLLGAYASLDLAVLSIKSGKVFSGVDFGDSRLSRLGDPLLIFGRSIKFLMIKANLSSIETSEGHFGRHWLIDKPTHPGVSGGPVVDSRGRVVGMAAYNPDGPAQLGVVLSAALIQKSSQQLIGGGKLTRAWIGVVPKNLVSLDDLDHIHGKDIKGGILIENLIVDGPAARAGLQIGDLLLMIGGKAVQETSDLQEYLDQHKSGEKVMVKAYRGSKGPMTLTLQLGDLPSAQDLPNSSLIL